MGWAGLARVWGRFGGGWTAWAVPMRLGALDLRQFDTVKQCSIENERSTYDLNRLFLLQTQHDHWDSSWPGTTQQPQERVEFAIQEVDGRAWERLRAAWSKMLCLYRRFRQCAYWLCAQVAALGRRGDGVWVGDGSILSFFDL